MRTPCKLIAAGPLGILLTTSPAAHTQPAAVSSRADPATHDQIASYVAEASQRFGIPEAWITAVMRVESGGDPAVMSSAGAIGLMQVMPDTYVTLRARLGLGANPYEAHDNIMAGAAYLRELHDRYGAVGFLAAYNAGPGRWEDHLAGVRPLPPETVRYMARLAPMLDQHDAEMQARAVSPAVTTPEAAPILVALSRQAADTLQRSTIRAAVQPAAVTVLADERTGALFTVRQPATGPQPNAVGTISTTTTSPFRPGASAAEQASTSTLSDPLFVGQISPKGNMR